MNQQVKMVLIMDSDGSVKRTICGFIVVVKKAFRYLNVFSYNHLYQPECFYKKRYNGIFSKFAIYPAWPGVALFNLAVSAGKISKRSAATK
jgi:hypothetical protein